MHRRDVTGYRKQLLRAAIRAEDRRDPNVPPLGRAGHGVGQTTEVPDTAGLCDRHGVLGVLVPLAVPEVRPWTAADCVKVAYFHNPLPSLAHEGKLGVEIEHLNAVARGG